MERSHAAATGRPETAKRTNGTGQMSFVHGEVLTVSGWQSVLSRVIRASHLASRACRHVILWNGVARASDRARFNKFVSGQER